MSILFFQSLMNGFMLAGLYCLIAAGVTLIFGVLHIVNFAQGAFLMLGSYMLYYMLTLRIPLLPHRRRAHVSMGSTTGDGGGQIDRGAGPWLRFGRLRHKRLFDDAGRAVLSGRGRRNTAGAKALRRSAARHHRRRGGRRCNHCLRSTT